MSGSLPLFSLIVPPHYTARRGAWDKIMGEHFEAAGFADIDQMVNAMVASENDQLLGVANFLRKNGLGELLRDHDWDRFARRYNGPNYAANDYPGKLHHFHQRYADGGLPDLQVRAAQIYLGYRGFPHGARPLAVDGVVGPSTAAAIRQFQQSRSLEPTGTVSDALITELLKP